MLITLALGAGSAACQSEPQPSDSAPSEAAAQRVAIGGVEWFVDYDAAVQVAREQDKALWVHFGEDPG